jgi:hypothetical protein
MPGVQGVKLYNSANDETAIVHDGMLGVSNDGHMIAERLITGHTPLFRIGFNPAITTSEEDLWCSGGKYTWPTAEQGMEVVSDDNTQDIGTVIKGDAVGDTVTSDADGTTTTLEDDSVSFTASTAVAVGDLVILDPHGTTPEFGFVTAVALHTLTIAGGFSSGGSAASRKYAVVDKSAKTNAQAVMVSYLDGDFVAHNEIVVLNGTTAVATVNTDIYRINQFSVIGAGSNNVALGNITIRNLADTPVYSHIAAGYTVARQLIFTVPAGYTAYITQANVSASTPNDTKVQSARIIVRTNTSPSENFVTDRIFYPKSEMVCSNGNDSFLYEIPIRILEKSDFIVSAQGFTGYSGPVAGVFRGYLAMND